MPASSVGARMRGRFADVRRSAHSQEHPTETVHSNLMACGHMRSQPCSQPCVKYWPATSYRASQHNHTPAKEKDDIRSIKVGMYSPTGRKKEHQTQQRAEEGGRSHQESD